MRMGNSRIAHSLFEFYSYINGGGNKHAKTH